MIELLRTNDLVLLSRLEAAFEAAGIGFFIADAHMSALEGSLGFLPRRLLVIQEDRRAALHIIQDLGLAGELKDG
jgi:hypothetical protein